ncbi:flagellar biosynthesis protein FlgI [Cognatishimia sp. D5M38]|uniref:Flagellar biosynthesis protein FlgI n=2 Tax=Cognatishimia coralii TaxID=3083254 RepID=A0ABU8QEM0_9RHOB
MAIAPTELDLQNIDAFASKISEAVSVLKQEIAGINDGQLNIVSELYNKKAGILKWLELKMPLIEPFMNDDAVKARRLPDRLAELKEAVSENNALLSRMSVAAGTIVREIEKAQNRHSLNGLYGKSGRRIGADGSRSRALDKEL